MKKTIALFLLIASSAIAADITISYQPLTERQRQGLQFVSQRENVAKLASGDTNFMWTVATYNRTNVINVLEARALADREAILDSYARQRDDAVGRARLEALIKKLLTANEAQLAQAESIVATNTPAP